MPHGNQLPGGGATRQTGHTNKRENRRSLSAVTHPGLRASDDDRRRVVEQLERHTADGRLTLNDYDDRVRQVYGATTVADLARITSDLPRLAPIAEPVRADHRPLLIAMVLAVATIALLGVLLAITK